MAYCALLSMVFFVYFVFMDNLIEVKAQLKELGNNLRRARVTRCVTLEALSEKANLNIRTLQRIEAGQMNVLITTVIRLQQGLDCPWYELLPTDSQHK